VSFMAGGPSFSSARVSHQMSFEARRRESI
jgi:hypothetical protein